MAFLTVSLTTSTKMSRAPGRNRATYSAHKFFEAQRGSLRLGTVFHSGPAKPAQIKPATSNTELARYFGDGDFAEDAVE